MPWLPTIHQLAYGADKLRGTCGRRQQQEEEEPEAEVAPGPWAPLAAHGRCPGAAARRSLAAPNGRAAAAPRPFGGLRSSPSSGGAREGKGGGFHILKAPGNICRGCSSSASRRGVRDETRAALV